VKEGLSITSTSKWSYEITFDRVADLRRGFGEFGGRRGLVENGGTNPKQGCYKLDGEWFEREAGRTGRQEGDVFNAPLA